MKENVKLLLNNLLRAIEYEREEERERHTEEIKKLSGYEREEKGRAFIGLHKRKIGRSMGGDWIYEFRKNGSKVLPDTEISIGDQVIISQFNPLNHLNPSGTVYSMSKKNISVAFPRAIKISNSNSLRMDLFVNDTTFKRMEEALTYAKTHTFHRLHTLLSGDYLVDTSESDIQINNLNEVQNISINKAIENNIFYSIQGPPGTGKTYTASYLIKQILITKNRILISADSNAAVDNLIRKLTELKIDVLRIGNPIRVNNDLKAYTLDYKILKHVKYKEITEFEKEIEKYKSKQGRCVRPNAKTTRGIPYDKLLELALSNQSMRGLSKKTIKSMRPWLKAQKKIDDLYKKIQSNKTEIQEYLINSHRVIATTNSTAGSDLLKYENFDWLIMDESAQASIPSSLIPVLKANRFILIGDHFQLPPVVISSEAKKLGLSTSLMDYLANKYPYQLTRLEVQYRMNLKINNLVSKLFYNNKLIPDISVRDRLIKKLYNENIIEVIDVSGHELRKKDSKSYYNNFEIDKVIDYIETLKSKGIEDSQIAVISPYKAQTIKIKDLIKHEIEVDTVDSFQGREKDIVIISFVRANLNERVGFLNDYRRLNVSISRAKSKLVLVGNFKTLKTDKLFNNMLNIIKN
ncbi:IGHMBP2 family helicase [Helicovermis profundi]|uniref:IGHMBP2 family helicase n=1 Tax=Helicovermis profundi TaxID=3065157 RepID=A0AAU9EUK6_9FIRM|nr:IGHMBP2 family helicase [Clostridia bacterium S502]